MADGKDKQVRCEVCGKRCTSAEAQKHQDKTGHHLWEILLPSNTSNNREGRNEKRYN